MVKKEWVQRCAARYETKAGLTPEQARDMATIAWEEDQKDELFINEPELAADEEMLRWGYGE